LNSLYQNGIFGSPGAGFDNFVALFQNPAFAHVFGNSLLLGFVPNILAILLASVAIALISLIRNKSVKLLAYAICAVFAFIPDICVATWITPLFKTQPAVPAALILLVMFWQMLKSFSMASVLGGFAACLFEEIGKRGFLARYSGLMLYGLYALANVLTQPTDLSRILFYGRSAAVNFDTFRYQALLTMQLGQSSAAWILRTVPQLLLGAGALVMCIFVLKRAGAQKGEEKSGPVPRKSGLGIVLSIVLAAAAIVCAVLAMVLYAGHSGMPGVGGLRNTVVITLFASLGFLILLVLTSFSAYSAKTAWIPAVLLLLTALSGNIIGQYFYLASTREINELLPVILILAGNVPLLFMGALFSRIGGLKALRYLLFVVGLFAAGAMGNLLVPLVNISLAESYPLPLAIYQVLRMPDAIGPGADKALGSLSGALVMLGLTCWLIFTALLIVIPSRKNRPTGMNAETIVRGM